MLGLPLPSIASNEVLNKLKPLYLDLLRDIKEKEEDSLYIRPLFDEDSPPSKAILLLYFLEYPSPFLRANVQKNIIMQILLPVLWVCCQRTLTLNTR